MVILNKSLKRNHSNSSSIVLISCPSTLLLIISKSRIPSCRSFGLKSKRKLINRGCSHKMPSSFRLKLRMETSWYAGLMVSLIMFEIRRFPKYSIKRTIRNSRIRNIFAKSWLKCCAKLGLKIVKVNAKWAHLEPSFRRTSKHDLEVGKRMMWQWLWASSNDIVQG